MLATVSLILTIHDRPPEVSRRVAESFALPGNKVDEIVIVLDRPTEEARKGAIEAWSGVHEGVKYVEIVGEPGWICPANAWNHAYEAATGDFLYQISSEVVQEAGNIHRMHKLVADGRSVVFGACQNSAKRELVVGAEPGFLAGSALPRPLGFIVCYPRARMTEIGGNDLAFMRGLWYEDDDLFLRLWQTGVRFVFDDSVSGVHLDHERPLLETAEGRAAIARNRALMFQKYKTVHPWTTTLRTETRAPGRVVWDHP